MDHTSVELGDSYCDDGGVSAARAAFHRGERDRRRAESDARTANRVQYGPGKGDREALRRRFG